MLKDLTHVGTKFSNFRLAKNAAFQSVTLTQFGFTAHCFTKVKPKFHQNIALLSLGEIFEEGLWCPGKPKGNKMVST